jgi:hypothetical protein
VVMPSALGWWALLMSAATQSAISPGQDKEGGKGLRAWEHGAAVKVEQQGRRRRHGLGWLWLGWNGGGMGLVSGGCALSRVPFPFPAQNPLRNLALRRGFGLAGQAGHGSALALSVSGIGPISRSAAASSPGDGSMPRVCTSPIQRSISRSSSAACCCTAVSLSSTS